MEVMAGFEYEVITSLGVERGAVERYREEEEQPGCKVVNEVLPPSFKLRNQQPLWFGDKEDPKRPKELFT